VVLRGELLLWSRLGREIICEADKAGDRACLRKSVEPHLIDLDTSELLTRGNVKLQRNNTMASKSLSQGLRTLRSVAAGEKGNVMV